jgi:sigma-B regulation protein RsbU (phosphoserine phosphatase)
MSSVEERQNRFELRTLLETSRLLIESHDPDFVLNNLLLITMGKLLISKGLILLNDPVSNTYKVIRSRGRDVPHENEEVDLRLNQNVLQVSSFPLKEVEVVGNENWKETEQGTLFNLRTSNYHLGFLYLGEKMNGEELTETESEFTESLAIISSVAIANSRMFKELQIINRRLDRKVHDLNTLLEMSKDFNLMVDIDEIARAFKFAMLGQMLIRTFFFLLDNNHVKSTISMSGIKETPFSEEIEAIFEQEENVIYVDESLKESIPFLNKNDIRLLIALEFQNQKTAVFGVGPRANEEPYGESEINFLQSLGNLALLSIEKTLLLEERIEKERLEEELNIAKTIQEGLLPTPIPQIAGYDIAAKNVSSRQVGGDYFDIIQTPDQGHLLAIADVTGKGIPASLLMANLQSMLHALTPLDITLSEATSRINDIIFDNTPSDKFITFFWGKLNTAGDNFNFVNAGHNPPYLLRKDSESPETLDAGGVILGAVSSMMPYDECSIDLKSGDLIVMFTDGVTEAMNPEQTEEFGEERLVDCILRNRDLGSAELMQVIIDEINAFAEHIQYDDITMIVMRKL